MAIHEKNVEGDIYCKCDTMEDFHQFCEQGGWDDENDFKKETRIDFDILEGKYFLVVHGRVYLEEES